MFQYYPFDVSTSKNGDVLFDIGLGDEVGTSGAKAVGSGSRSMSTSVRILTMRKHVVVQSESFGLHGFKNQIGYWRKVMGFNAQETAVAVCVFSWLKPGLAYKRLRLQFSWQLDI